MIRKFLSVFVLLTFLPGNLLPTPLLAVQNPSGSITDAAASSVVGAGTGGAGKYKTSGTIFSSRHSLRSPLSRRFVSSPHPIPGGNPIFFNDPTYVLGGVYAYSIAAGDVNNDGILDLVIAEQCPNNNCSTGGVTVMLGNGDGTFQIGRSYSSGGYEAFSVAIGDLNADGKKDIVVANGCQSSTQCTNGVVGVLLGNGDGTFQSPASYSSGGIAASSVAIAKLNNDGKADLAVANQCMDVSCSTGGVGVLFGNGDGTFQAAQSYASGGYTAVSVAVADFNLDGRADLAVANQCASATDCTGTVGVLMGASHGAFQPAVSFSAGGYKASSVAAGDLNGDKRNDLVVATQCQSSGNCTTGAAGVLLGNGDGTFQAPVSYSTGGNTTSSVSLAKLNSDGNIDLVVSSQCQDANNCSQGLVSVLQGNGDGSFQTAQTYVSEGVFANDIATGDWNGKGNADVAVLNQCQNGSSCSATVTILFSNGDGTLRCPPTYTSTGYDADAVAVGDLNGDGKPDLVVADLCQGSSCKGGSAGGQLEVFLGNGDGTFQPRQTYDTGDFGTSSVAIADLNGDGKADVVAANQCSTSDCSNGGSVSVLLGNGDGILQTAQNYPSGGFTSLSVAVSDFNRDGNPDLVVANQCQDSSCSGGSFSILKGRGDGTFSSAVSYPSGAYETDFVTIGDFNGDGNPDLALASLCQDSSCGNGGVSVAMGKGDGTFQPAVSFDSGGWQADFLAVADMDGDGNPDLVASNACRGGSDCSNGLISVWLGKGDGTFRTIHTYSSGGQNAFSLVAADFNGDGPVDVVSANSDATYVLLGNGDGTLQSASPYNPNGVFVASGDFNRDKQPDVVVAGGASSNITVLLNIVSGYRQATSTTLTSSPNPSVAYQSVLLTAQVKSPAGGSPSGTVSFNEGSTVLGTAPVSNGQASLGYGFAFGSHTVTASYSGDSSYVPSTSAPVKQKVSKATSTTTLTASPNPSNQGQTVTFTATVAGQYGGTATGTVTFKDGGNVLAQIKLHSGVAIYKTSKLSRGKHRIAAAYSGDQNFHTSSASLTQVVQ